MELTDAQKRKIDENRAKALAILEAKKREEPRVLCEYRSESGDGPCTSLSVDMELYEVFGEKVCSVCKLHNEMFELITKSDAVSTYLVTDDAMTTLKFKTRDNPHNPGWTPMKLYLRKHVHSLSMKRFGSEEKLAEEKKERESQKYERFLVKTGDALSSSTKGFRADLNAHPEDILTLATADSEPDAKRKRGGKPQTESQKRKKVALGNLVSIIRGNQS